MVTSATTSLVTLVTGQLLAAAEHIKVVVLSFEEAAISYQFVDYKLPFIRVTNQEEHQLRVTNRLLE